MNLKYCKNISDGEYELILHGEIGEDIIGRAVASEILYLNSIGAKKIKERINTIGGSIIDAYAIVSANIASECEIYTINEGIADSAGSFILASGDKGKRSAMDFATMLLHNPSYDGVMLEDMEEGEMKREMEMMRDSIVTILSNNSSKTAKEIRDKMTEAKRMTANEAKEYGIIDNVVKSVKKPSITENMSMAEIMNICRVEEDNSILNNNTMKQVLSYLNLSEDASEVSALQAVQNIAKKAETAESKVGSLESDIDGLKNQVSEKDTEIAELKSKVSEYENKEREAAVKNAIGSGKFSEDNKEELENQVKVMGVENFNKMVDMFKLPKADAAAQIQNNSAAPRQTSDEKLAEEYEKLAKENPAELGRIKNQEPARFEKMFNAWNQ